MTNKDFFKYYLYSTINLYYQTRMLMSEGMSYREFKVARSLEYFGLSGLKRRIAKSLMGIVIFMETPISVLVEIVYFVKCFFLSLFTSKKHLKNETILYGRGAFVEENLLKKSHFDLTKIVVIVSPLETNNSMYKSYKRIPLLSLVGVKDLFVILGMSFKMSFFVKKKYGYRDCLYRSYSSFGYFLVCFAYRNMDISNRIVFTSIDDRWAYLLGHLPNFKTFIQHGIFPLNVNYYPMGKIGTADVGYYFNEQQRDLCNKHLFNNVPQTRYMDTMKFTGNEKLLNNGRYNVLLICHSAFFNKEEKIIQELTHYQHLNLYVKPHPADHSTRYSELHEKVDFVILDKGDYPRVDAVIAYESTLALEYAQVGVKVLMYEDKDFERQYEQLKRA